MKKRKWLNNTLPLPWKPMLWIFLEFLMSIIDVKNILRNFNKKLPQMPTKNSENTSVYSWPDCLLTQKNVLWRDFGNFGLPRKASCIRYKLLWNLKDVFRSKTVHFRVRHHLQNIVHQIFSRNGDPRGFKIGIWKCLILKYKLLRKSHLKFVNVMHFPLNYHHIQLNSRSMRHLNNFRGTENDEERYVLHENVIKLKWRKIGIFPKSAP